MRKMLALLMVIVLTAGLVPSLALAESPMEITIAMWDVETNFASNDQVLQDIEAKLNIKLVPVNVTWSDFTQKAQVWAASEELPDIMAISIRETASYYEWANQGLLKAIPNDLSAYPYLEKYMADPGLGLVAVDGAYYCIPRKTYAEQAETVKNRSIAYRWDLAQAAGVTKEPETWGEFREMIQAIIKADPEGKAIQGLVSQGYGQLLQWLYCYSVPMGASNNWVQGEDGKYLPAYFAGNPIPALQLARDMYTEGTIVTDVALITAEQAADMLLQGKAAAMQGTTFSGFYDIVGRYWKELHGTEFLDCFKCLTLPDDVNGNDYYPIWGYAWSESIFSSKVSDEKMDKIMQLYDYLLSDEGAFLSCFGYEGVDYELVDSRISLLKDAETGATVVPSEKYPSTNSLGIIVRWAPNSYEPRWPMDERKVDYEAFETKRVELARQVEIPAFDTRYAAASLQLGTGFSWNLNDDVLLVMMGTEPVADMWQSIYDNYVSTGLLEYIEQVNEAVAAE